MDSIKGGFADLSPQFQVGAKYLIDHPDEIAMSSMRAIANNANVQSSTLVRFAQHLGFKGWPEFKEIFVNRIRSTPGGYAQKAKTITKQMETRDLITEVFETQQLNIQTTEEKNHATLTIAAKLLESVRHVHVAGFRASYPIAFSFQYLYRFFRATVYLISGQAGTLEMGMRAIGKDDGVVVISFAPYSSEAIVVANAARGKGCKVIAITDSDLSPIALAASISVVIAVDSPSFFPSIVAGVATIESLIELLVSRAGPAAIKQIETAEKQLFEFGAYEKTTS